MPAINANPIITSTKSVRSEVNSAAVLKNPLFTKAPFPDSYSHMTECRIVAG
jgi:hypothetical protein